MIAYLPTSRTITVNMASVSGSTAVAWWYDPSTGTATSIGTFPSSGSRTFTPPASSGGDFVFVLDDGSRGFSPPGTVVTAVPALSWMHVASAAAALVVLGCVALRRQRRAARRTIALASGAIRS